MNLTFDARLVTSSGIGVYIQNLVRSPLLLNYNLTLLHKSHDKKFLCELAEKANLIEFDADLYSLKELLTTSAKTINTDIFWSPHYNVPLVNFALKLKVVTIHDVFHLAYFHTLSAQQKVYAKLMINRAIKSDVIFTVSEFSKSEIVKFTDADPDKIKVVYNGIDFDKFSFKYSPEQKANTLARYNLVDPFILFVGNIKPHKNLKTALLGYQDLIVSKGKAFAEIKFVIAGKREGFITADEELKTVLADPFFRGKVQFTGWVSDEDLPILYQLASIFIFPSLYEGFGFPPLEAMAAGCPVISSNASCLPEVYQDAALYFNPLNKSEIAEVLSAILSDTKMRNSLTERGLAQARKYNWETGVSEKLKIINDYL